tara:strand:- start:1118 stop:2305 length:1188 start_codon:yes stop_codon:yes gene_type:complete
MKFFREEIDPEKYVIATYFLEGVNDLASAAWCLAIGQSVGNPNVRNCWETDELFENHSCVIQGLEEELMSVKSGIVKIGFPAINTDWKSDGISHMLCQLMGGQMDIDNILQCRLKDIQFPKSVLTKFLGPRFGIKGVREYTGVQDKPLLGAIIKPKIGVSPEVLKEMVKELVDGGVNFIKEDEIMSNPSCCPLEDRVKLISQTIKNSGKKVIYAYCINGDPHSIRQKVETVHSLGGNAVHINVWSGLGVYRSIREMDLPLFIHFQKSGDKTFTDSSHRFGIDWSVICSIAGMSGVDFIHAGMWGGYSSDSEEDLKLTFKKLEEWGVVPALSCGMHAGLVNKVTDKFGIDYMANVGGSIHGHPDGTLSGAKAMRQAIDHDFGEEYDKAILKWGLHT